jgi:hypothetical protein
LAFWIGEILELAIKCEIRTTAMPFIDVTGFVSVPDLLMQAACAITGLYVLAAEGTKHWFFRSPPLATAA